jgi:polyisoprenoid-binding protein YceI
MHPGIARIGMTMALTFLLPWGTASAAEYAIDASHTSVHFAVSHFDISYVRGRIAKVAGSIQFDAERKTGAIDVRIDAGSLDTGNATLDQVLRSEQFLDVGQFGDARFGGSAFVFEGDKLAAIDGTLILRGIARPVRLTVRRFVCKDVKAGIATRYVCGGEFQATIKRTDFGMARFLPEVGDQVDLVIGVEAARQ